MSAELRSQVLRVLDDHSRTGSVNYLSDTELAVATGAGVIDVRRALDVLESEALIDPANALDGQSARITPAGTLTVERLS